MRAPPVKPSNVAVIICLIGVSGTQIGASDAQLAAKSSGSAFAVLAVDPNQSTTVAPGNSTAKPSDTLFGAAISISGNLFISVALNIQKKVHMRIEAEKAAGVETQSFSKHKLWWAGVSLMALGELGNFGAYFFAPAVLVAPLGTVTVISNSIIAPCWLGERFRTRDGFGVLAAASGAIVIVAEAPDEITPSRTASELWNEYLSTPRVIVYATLLIVTGIAMFVMLKKGHGEKHILIPLMLTTVLGCFTILSVKATAMLLNETFEGNSQFRSPLIYVMALLLAGSAVMQVKWLNYSMQFFDSTEVVPTFFVLFTLGAISVGGVMYNDFAEMPEGRILGFLFGVLCTFTGVFLITGGAKAKDGSGSESSGSSLSISAEQAQSSCSELDDLLHDDGKPMRHRTGSCVSRTSNRSVRGSVINPWLATTLASSTAPGGNVPGSPSRSDVGANPIFSSLSLSTPDYTTQYGDSWTVSSGTGSPEADSSVPLLSDLMEFGTDEAQKT